MGRLSRTATPASTRLARAAVHAVVRAAGSGAFRLALACALATLLMLALLDPLAAREPRRFVDGAAEGWFWYADPPPPAQEPEPETPEEAPPAVASAAAPDAAPAASAPGPAPLSVEWLQVHLDRYKNRAIDDPTPDNVRAYLLLQRVSMDKASAFAEAVQAATVGDPLLDATMERPIASFAAQEMDRTAHRARQALIGVLAETVGLVFFYRSDCPFCERQAPILAGLSDATGLSVMAVAVDHRPMASGAFAVDWTPDRGQAASLGVQTVPAIYALRPPGEAALIAQGLMDLTELTSRLLLVARQQGWISEEAFEATRPVRRQTVSPVLAADLDAATLDDPAALVAALRARMTRGGAP
jgi:conjugal transfer pilus assembly protein TraF